MKQTNFKLTHDEASVLKEYFKTSQVPLIRHKAQAAIMYASGLDLEQVSQFLFRTSRTISRWIVGFEDKRLASIFSGHVDNENAKKLTREQKLEIKTTLKEPPTEHRLSKDFWDVPQLKTYVQAKFGVVFESERSYHFLLKFSDLSFKYPDTFSVRRNDDLIKDRIVEIREEIKPYLQDSAWEVFAADETRMVLEALTRKAWLRRGEKTVIKVQQSNEYQSYFGALNQKNFKCHAYELDWQNQDEILKSLKQLLDEYPDKKICLVWDNAAFHKGKIIREALKQGNLLERVHLINFPPYAPDFNPIERVWNAVKASLSNKQFDSFDETKGLFLEEIGRRTFDYKI